MYIKEKCGQGDGVRNLITKHLALSAVVSESDMIYVEKKENCYFPL